MKLISRMGLCLNLFYSCPIACHVCEHFFHLLEMYLWQQYLSWLRMNDASACKNICTFPRCSWEHLMNTNFWIQSKPSQTWIFLQSCISPAIYHHFQFEETVFTQKKEFSKLCSKLIGFWMMCSWHTKPFKYLSTRHILMGPSKTFS